MLIPTLVTARLILRGLSEDDAGAYERHFVDYEVVRHLPATVRRSHDAKARTRTGATLTACCLERSWTLRIRGGRFGS